MIHELQYLYTLADSSATKSATNPIKRTVDNFLMQRGKRFKAGYKNDNNSQIAHTPRATWGQQK